MFYDYVKIYCKGGDGGNGLAAFRREKYVPFGGPAGGDGGKGGDVIFVADDSLTTLEDFKYRQHYKAQRGANGMNKNMFGKKGENLIAKVPVGTIIRDDETKEILADLTEPGQTAIIVKGGRGGRGNATFKNSKNPTPEFAERGEPGEERWLRLELKLLADVGLIGMPNAGKSTIISKVSGSKPKIADYPFTTIVPNLGVVQLEPGMSFVMADVPGLIEGAHEGQGLGHRFLRHVERTRLLIHVVDMSGFSQREPWDDFATINQELRLYRADLAERPQIVVANKMDMPEAQGKLAEFKKRIGKNSQDEAYQIFEISALTGAGLKQLMYQAYDLLQHAPLPASVAEEERKVVKVENKPEFEITQDEDGAWVVSGEKVEKLVIMTDWENDAALRRLQHILTKIGIDDALRRAGAIDGDLVRIANQEFDWAD